MAKKYITLIIISSFVSSVAFGSSVNLMAGYERFDSKRRIDNTAIAYGVVDYQLLPQWDAEFLAGVMNTKSHHPTNPDRSVNGKLFSIAARYRLIKRGEWQPFVAAGVGASVMQPNGTDATAQGNVNLAGGFEYFFHPKVALRVEARDFYTVVGGKNDVVGGLGVTFVV